MGRAGDSEVDALLARAQHGDRQARERLMEWILGVLAPLRPRIDAFLCDLGSPVEAVDVFQEVALAVLRRGLDAFENELHLRFYVLKLAHRRPINAVDADRLGRFIDELADEFLARVPDSGLDPLDECIRNETRDRVRAAAEKQLSPNARAVFQMAIMDKMTSGEIAERLDLNENTVRSLVRRSRLAVAEDLRRGGR